MNDRKPGHYWVRVDDGEPEIAEYNSEQHATTLAMTGDRLLWHDGDGYERRGEVCWRDFGSPVSVEFLHDEPLQPPS